MARGFKGSDTPVEIRNYWRTPEYAFLPLDAEFNFGLDAAANAQNFLVPSYLTEQQDALSQRWLDYILPFCGRTVWCNPPYSDIGPWMRKAAEEARRDAVTTVLFVPNTPDAGWWPDDASEIRFITGEDRGPHRNVSGRVNFVRADTGEEQRGNNKGSCYVIFAPGSMGNMVTKYIKKSVLLEKTEAIKAERNKGASNA